MTNADKIRLMNDEELVEWLRMLKWLDGLTCACMSYDHWRCDDYETCRECWKDWLTDGSDGADKKTRAEWIRSMSDEELLEWLCDVGACMVDNNSPHCGDNRCRECWMAWLAEDADGADGVNKKQGDGR